MGSALKKTVHAQEQDREDVAQARQAWRCSQPDLDPSQLVFIDETSCDIQMSRRYGRCNQNKRLVAKVPHGHYKRTHFVAALRQTELTAPLVLDGAMTGEGF